MRIRPVIAVVVACGLIVPAAAHAAIVQYDDGAAWLAAAGGTTDLDEDFEGFAADTLFRLAPVNISMGTLAQVGVDLEFRNLVETPPFEFTDNNGTNHASCFVNYPEGGTGTETNVELVFNDPVMAWGAEFTGVLGGEFLAIDVNGAEQTIIGTLLPAANDTFLGFVADAGEEIDMVIFRSQNDNPGGAGEGFGADNFGAVLAAAQPPPPEPAIPTLGTLGLMVLIGLLAGIGIILLRSRH